MLNILCFPCRDCQFSLNQTAPQTVDVELGVQGYWAMCSQECKRQFLKNWLRVHYEVAAQKFGERHCTNGMLTSFAFDDRKYRLSLAVQYTDLPIDKGRQLIGLVHIWAFGKCQSGVLYRNCI